MKIHLLFAVCGLFMLVQVPFVKELRVRGMVQRLLQRSGSVEESTLELLSLENHLLKDELDAVRAQLQYEVKEFQVVQAKVIYRENLSFGSFVWIDRGESDNRRLGSVIIAKKSPVVLGQGVVGVVEEVLEKKSLVRLITDPKLPIAVRVDRGQKGSYVEERLQELSALLEHEEPLFNNKEHQELTQEWLQLLTERARPSKKALLAKGVVQGVLDAGWRVPRTTLYGYGFNYDFADSEGGPIDLRAGGLIQVGDLLVTTGLDGVFPKGLHVGVVQKIDPLKEGAYAYTLEATAAVHALNDLDHVQILPPL